MGTDNIIVLGDMNAWRNEDPIRLFRDFGYIELVEQLSGLPQHSFLYWGQIGTLDYAFASSALAEYARKAEIWNINASWPQKMEQPQPWLRASDHDPVIVDLDFSQSATSN
jgi:predicted extracellular nuclease